MARFVHLTPEKNVNSILKNGIESRKCKKWVKSKISSRGVFCMPVTRNFYVSHQWLRELKRSGQRTICAVYFLIPDDTIVWIGHYNKNHMRVRASEAIGMVMTASKPEGYEVIVPRSILGSEIKRVRTLPQVLGWRYWPGAHGRKPCTCPVCLKKGEIKSQRIREKYD